MLRSRTEFFTQAPHVSIHRAGVNKAVIFPNVAQELITRLDAAGPLRFSLLNHVQDPVSVRVYFAALAVVMVLFTVGWHTRVMGVLLYLGQMSIHNRNISSANGADVAPR